MNDYHREERTTTVVRHSMTTPVNWAEMQKLLRIVIRDMGYADRADQPADDLIWYEVADDEVVICYELMSGSIGQRVTP